MAGICARTGWAGQAHIDLFVPSTILFTDYHRTRSEAQSEHEASTERAGDASECERAYAR